ncbi:MULTISPECIES: DUF1707 and DUF4870 domain-containing protein [Thermomonosporaceae]|uniref:DUF1707 and DUF4870 domain-containing protein n=1 Tax=Thermomonosporaceae TaxID=2012 RepID=UPI00255B3A6C|nr:MULTISPECIES: DUF1707 and DUF4870 domain-containing protein [Thermomonosporaceae]MDL4775178.1 DUF1707 and DUF4870 domain-containing protein [Actinomadura xylanilytica]
MDSSHTVGDLRVSDAEREPVIQRLQEAYADGRVDHEEFEMRMHLAMTAKTRSDLAVVCRDLVPPEPDRRPAEAVSGEDRMLAAVAHGIGYVTLFVGPLVLMLLSGRRSEYVRRHAAEAVNFQLTVLVVTIVTFGLGGILYAVTWIAAGIAALMALSGQDFRYPWILRLVK